MRTARRLFTVSLLLLMSLVLAAPPASADWTNDAGGNAGGGGGSTGGRVDGVDYVCAKDGSKTGWDERYGKFRFVRYQAFFIHCEDHPNRRTWQSTGNNIRCHVGFEVFRFYSLGSTSSHPDAMVRKRFPTTPNAYTRSVIGQPEWCRRGDFTAFFPHPGDHVNLGGGTMWTHHGGASSNNGHSVGQWWTKAANGRLTTNGVEGNQKWNRGGSCASLSVGAPDRPSVDPLAKYFKDSSGRPGPEFDTDSGRYVRDRYFRSYEALLQQVGPQFAANMINAANGSARIPNRDAILYGDEYRCGSDMDFSSEPGAKPVIYGTCYIPLEKRATVFQKARNSNIKTNAYYTNAENRGGTRYTNEYASPAARGDEAPEWRNYIRGMVATNPNGFGTPYTGNGNGQYTSSMTDRVGAGNYAAANAKCHTQLAAMGSENSTTVTTPADYVKVTLTAPDVFQTGYAMAANGTPNTVTASGGTLMCGDRACDDLGKIPGHTPKLTTLHFGLDLRGTNGYAGPVRSSTGQVSGNCSPTTFTAKHTGQCDFIVARGQQNDRAPAGDGTRADPRLDRMVTQQGMFFSPTQRSNGSTAAQKVNVQFTGGVGARPYAKYSRPTVTKSTIKSCLPAIGCENMNLSKIEYSIQDVPIRVYGDMTADGVNNPVLLAEIAPGEPAPAPWARDTIGATGMSK